MVAPGRMCAVGLQKRSLCPMSFFVLKTFPCQTCAKKPFPSPFPRFRLLRYKSPSGIEESRIGPMLSLSLSDIEGSIKTLQSLALSRHGKRRTSLKKLLRSLDPVFGAKATAAGFILRSGCSILLLLLRPGSLPYTQFAVKVQRWGI